MKFQKTKQWNGCGEPDLYEGERLIHKLQKATEGKNGLEETWPLTYTNKSDGVLPAYDIRTDRWEIAQDGMDKLYQAEAAKLAKKQSPDSEMLTNSQEENNQD